MNSPIPFLIVFSGIIGVISIIWSIKDGRTLFIRSSDSKFVVYGDEDFREHREALALVEDYMATLSDEKLRYLQMELPKIVDAAEGESHIAKSQDNNAMYYGRMPKDDRRSEVSCEGNKYELSNA